MAKEIDDIIYEAYTQALLAARSRGKSGTAAQEAACKAAAGFVTKHTGQATTAEEVHKIVHS